MGYACKTRFYTLIIYAGRNVWDTICSLIPLADKDRGQRGMTDKKVCPPVIA